jgi:hypothetical protein
MGCGRAVPYFHTAEIAGHKEDGMRIKMLGLAALAALSLTAFIGVASASATELCSTNNTGGAGNGCAAFGSAFKFGTNINAADTIAGSNLGNAVLTTTSGTITCTGSTFTASFPSTGGAGSVTSLAWTGCTSTITGCTVSGVTSVTPITASLAGNGAVGTTGPHGTVSLTNPSTTVNCGGGVTCTYAGANTVNASVYNYNDTNKPVATNAHAQANINQTVNKSAGGFLCPASGTETVTYQLIPNNGGGDLLLS